MMLYCYLHQRDKSVNNLIIPESSTELSTATTTSCCTFGIVGDLATLDLDILDLETLVLADLLSE